MMLLPMEHYPLLANIHALLTPGTYLEIGVQHGQSMNLACRTTKCFGVDPSPDIRFPLNPDAEIFQCTSDRFFQEKADTILNGRKIDLAFIDGMHLFEFSLRDFIHIERFATPDSVILLHDTIPINAVASSRERTTRSWCGDVFKLILGLKKYRPDLKITNVNVKPSGLAIITGLHPESDTLEKNYEKIVAEFMPLKYGDIESEEVSLLNIRENNPRNIAEALAPVSRRPLPDLERELLESDNADLRQKITALENKIATPQSTLHKVEVFFSDDPVHFLSEHKVQKVLDSALEEWEVELPEGAGHFLRVDLGASSAAFELGGIQILDRAGNLLWEWDGNPNSFRGCASSYFLSHENRIFYVTLGNDPQLFLPELTAGQPGRLRLSCRPVKIQNAARETAAALQERKKFANQCAILTERCKQQEMQTTALEQESREREADLVIRKMTEIALREKNADLEQKLDKTLLQNQNLEQTCGKLHQELKFIRDSLNNAIFLNNDLEQKSVKLQIELDSTRNTLTEANLHNRSLLQQRTELQEKLSDMQNEQRAMQKRQEQQEKQLSESQTQCADLSRKNAKQEEVLKEQGRRLHWLLTSYYTIVSSRFWRFGSFLRRLFDRSQTNVREPSSDDCRLLESSDLFDAVWYWKRYPEVAESGLLPVEHYLRIGWREEKDPSPRFSTFYYLTVNKDVAARGRNPLLHYLNHGQKEHRKTAPAELPPRWFELRRKLRAFIAIGAIKRSGLFDTQWYLEQNPDFAENRNASFWMKLRNVPLLSFAARYMVSPIRHYVLLGAAERRNPCLGFNTREFLQRNPDAIARDLNPFYLFLKQKEARDEQKQSEARDYHLLKESPLFDPDYYLRYNPDIRRRGTDPIRHFMKSGWREGRNPSAAFDVQYYFEQNPDLLKNGNVENPLLHYLKRGKKEQRAIVPAVFPRVMSLEKILKAYRPGDITTLSTANPRKPGKILIVIHLFYEDMLPEFIGYLKNIPYEFDIAITLTEHSSFPADQILKEQLPKCRKVHQAHAKNFGRDIGPFLVEFGMLCMQYDYICKFHTKKDLSGGGAAWRSLALRNMLGSEQLVRNILAEFEKNPSTGMIYPRPPLVALSAVLDRGAWGGNLEAACELGRRVNLDFSEMKKFDFPAGSMFWARTKAMEKLLTLPVSYDDFSRTIGWDGSPAHAVERMFGAIPILAGYSLKSVFVYPPEPETPPEPYVPVDDQLLLERIREYKARKRPGNRIAVYTAMAGGYDSIPTPEELDPEVDYICFSDSILEGEHPWEMRPLDYFNADRTRITRYYKLHPHTYFSQYDYVIWIDSNILIRRNIIHKLIETYKTGGNPIATIRHPERNCTYIEARICSRSQLDDAKLIDAQIERYREAGLPEKGGLPETNIYVTAPNDPRSIRLFAEWWQELENGSRRDQLSIMYVLFKNNLSYTPLFDNYEDGPRYNLTDFTYFMHKNHENLMFPSIYRYPWFISERRRSISDDLAARAAALSTGDPKLDVIIPVHNALPDLKNCLASVMPTLGNRQNVILVNDGSDQDTTAFLTDFVAAFPEKIRLIIHEKARGYTISINEAARSSSADYLVFLNSDTIVPPNWWRKLVRCAESSPDIGIVGPLSNAASWQTIPVLREGSGYCINSLPPGVTIADADRICEETARPGFYPKCQLINGFCFFVKKAVFDRIGLFDEENFPTGYGEEDDLCFRAVNAGFVSAMAVDTYVFHAKSKSFGHATRQELCRQNQQKFLKKHPRSRLERECKTLEAIPELIRMRTLTGDRFAVPATGKRPDKGAGSLLKPGCRLGAIPRRGKQEGTYFASSHVRLLDWLKAYTEEGRSAEILNADTLPQYDFTHYDAIVVCRDAIPAEQTGCFLAKCNAAGIPFFMELDDHLFLVPEMDAIWPTLERMVRAAAGLIVSVPPLMEAFRPFNPNIMLKPNCLNRDLWLDTPTPQLDAKSAEVIERNRRKVNVVYYGSFTHNRDLAVISRIIPAMKKRLDVQFFLIGGCKDEDPAAAGWVTLPPPVMSYNKFIPWFRAVAATMDIGVAPLDPCKGLNAYKSPLKFLEGGICRLCMVCSPLVYDSVVENGENGLLADFSEEAWEQALARVIENVSLRRQLADRAFAEIREKRIISSKKLRLAFQEEGNEE